VLRGGCNGFADNRGAVFYLRRRLRSHGSNQRWRSRSRNKVQAAAFTETVSLSRRQIQGILRADRLRKKPGAVPGSDPAELSQSREAGTDGRANLPDVTRCDAGCSARDPG